MRDTRKDKLPNISITAPSKGSLGVAQQADNFVSKQGQLEMIKLLANQEVSRH